MGERGASHPVKPLLKKIVAVLGWVIALIEALILALPA